MYELSVKITSEIFKYYILYDVLSKNFEEYNRR